MFLRICFCVFGKGSEILEKSGIGFGNGVCAGYRNGILAKGRSNGGRHGDTVVVEAVHRSAV